MKRNGMKLAAMLVLVCMLMTGCALLPTTVGDSANSGVSVDGDTVTISREEYDRLMKYAEVEEIKKTVETYYYQEPDEQDMLDGAAAGLLAGLQDPYTFYYTPEEYAKMWEDDEGDYAGVGMQIMGNYVTGLCTISRVFLNSPALEAGIRKGDILTRVEDIDVTATTL